MDLYKRETVMYLLVAGYGSYMDVLSYYVTGAHRERSEWKYWGWRTSCAV